MLAVAAVDRGLRPYCKVNRGAYIAFAAPGVDLVMGHASYSGTSYAAAFVTAVVAGVVARDQALDPASVELRLAASALDLGAPGRDPVFGWGSVRSPDGCVTPS